MSPYSRKRAIEVRPGKGADRGWEVARQGTKGAISKHRTQQAAVNKGKPIAKRERSEFVLKGRTGRIRARSRYGNV